MFILFALLTCLLGQPQDGAKADDPPSSSLGALKARVHKMRKDLLIGGERALRAESEAFDFYVDKVEDVDQRVDGIQVDLVEKRASYDLALERVVSARDPSSIRSAAEEAARMRRGITSLEGELGQLGRRRQELAQLTTALEARKRERDRLESRLDSGSNIDALMLSLPGIGLAPNIETQEASSFFSDDSFIADLMQHAPIEARQALLAIDPVGYWRRWPLRPPSDILLSALPFPTPDLPGGR